MKLGVRESVRVAFNGIFNIFFEKLFKGRGRGGETANSFKTFLYWEKLQFVSSISILFPFIYQIRRSRVGPRCLQ